MLERGRTQGGTAGMRAICLATCVCNTHATPVKLLDEQKGVCVQVVDLSIEVGAGRLAAV